MRHAAMLFMLAFASPVAAEPLGPPPGEFVASWSTPLTSQLTPWDNAPAFRIAGMKPAAVSDNVMSEAFASAGNSVERLDLAMEETANAFEPAQRLAFEDLRDVQHAYATSAGGDRFGRSWTFAGLIHDLVEGRGRSVAHDSAADAELDKAYADATRHAGAPGQASLQASETAWSNYREAFSRFAQAMDRPDAVASLRDDLARRRASELQGSNGH